MFPRMVFSMHQTSLGILSLLIAVAAAPSIDEPVTTEFNKTTFDKVDGLVQKHFYTASGLPAWKHAVNENRSEILGSKTISALDANINKTLASLHSSHTQFVTTNDETFYFLKTLFASRSKKQKQVPMIDFVGAITGGVTSAPHQVRYVLDGSPAQQAGIRIGDEILSVNGAPYIGQLSWKGTAGNATTVKLRRADEERQVTLKPLSKNDYDAYVDAIGKSIKTTKYPEGNIAYIHMWCGSEDAHDALEEALDKVEKTDGLILDLRDGYGGNFFNDLDYFYRPRAAYPSFTTISRNGKSFTSGMVYDKPLVVLINGGSRSGKELLAYSLKKTKRAILVGENTAGAVLAGRLFDVNDRAALYLAVAGGDVEGIVLEGKGIAPDIEVKIDSSQRGRQDLQYEEAVRVLREKLSSKKLD